MSESKNANVKKKLKEFEMIIYNEMTKYVLYGSNELSVQETQGIIEYGLIKNAAIAAKGYGSSDEAIKERLKTAVDFAIEDIEKALREATS